MEGAKRARGRVVEIAGKQRVREKRVTGWAFNRLRVLCQRLFVH